MFLSENVKALEDALESGNQTQFNAAVVSFLKEIAAQVDMLKLDIEDVTNKTDDLVSNYEYMNANMQVIKQAIVGDIKVETVEDEYKQDDDDCNCH